MSNFHPDPKPSFLKQRIERKIQNQRDKTNAGRSHRFFYKSLWQTSKHYCYECGVTLPFYDKSFCHHIIGKRFQKKYTINLDSTDNGILLCFDCHNQVELNIDKVPKVKKLTELQLKNNEQYLIKQ